MSRLADFPAYIQSAMPSWPCPGVALAIVRGDEVLLQAAYGLADVENQAPLTPGESMSRITLAATSTVMPVAASNDARADASGPAATSNGCTARACCVTPAPDACAARRASSRPAMAAS